MIVTLTLIGTGWAFIKYVLSEREKKLFLIVVPLQIFVNIAFIIFKETEEGQKEYTSWSHVMILLDLLRYALILYPVYWSIKHLQQVRKDSWWKFRKGPSQKKISLGIL